jgi:hypothetical protein
MYGTLSVLHQLTDIAQPQMRDGMRHPRVMWFSAMVRLVVFVGEAIEGYDRSLFVFHADGVPAAHREAVRLGRTQQSTYDNEDGAIVRWQLVRVETLDALGDVVDDGREVFSERLPYDGEPLPDAGPEDLPAGSAGIGR